MLATSPVDGEYNFAGGVIDVSNNGGDERTQELLARPHGDARRVPSGLKIICEPRKVGRAGWFRRRARRQTRFKFLDTAKSHFPGVFKLRGTNRLSDSIIHCVHSKPRSLSEKSLVKLGRV